jgi:hypothetical protein
MTGHGWVFSESKLHFSFPRNGSNGFFMIKPFEKLKIEMMNTKSEKQKAGKRKRVPRRIKANQSGSK